MSVPARRAPSGLVVAGVAAGIALALAAAAVMGWVATQAPQSGPGTGWFDARARSAARSFAETTTSLQLASLLAQRGEAVTVSQPRQFLAGAGSDVRAEQRQVYRRLAAVPFEQYQTDLAGSWSPTFAELASGRLIVPVRIRSRLPHDPVTVPDRGWARFGFARGRWWLLGLTPRHPQVWDLARVDAAAGSRSLALVAEEVDDAATVAAEADAAVAAVAARWPLRWLGRVVVVMPSAAAELGRLVGIGGSSGVAAVTSYRGNPAGRVVRVQLNPAIVPGLDPLARQVLLRHEVTHAAQYGRHRDDVPVWLAEGTAEYLGYLGSGVPDDVVASMLMAEVRSGSVPDRLPGTADFAFAAGEEQRRGAYERAWTACRAVVDRYGEAALFELYRVASQGTGTRAERERAALRQVLGVSPDAFVRQWQDWLRSHS